MQKDASYHRAAIQYNEELADFASELAKRLEHEEVQRWSRAVSKQHEFHAIRHLKALKKLEKPEEKTEKVGPGPEGKSGGPEASVEDPFAENTYQEGFHDGTVHGQKLAEAGVTIAEAQAAYAAQAIANADEEATV